MALIIGAVAWLLAGRGAGHAALVGGAISVIVNAGFARWALSGPPMSSERFLARMVIGELLKLALTVALFVAAIVWLELAFLPLIGAFAICLVSYWLLLLI